MADNVFQFSKRKKRHMYTEIDSKASRKGKKGFNKEEKSFLKRFSQYIGLKYLVRLVVTGIIVTIGTFIIGFKGYQIYSYESFNSNFLKARLSYDDMYSLCNKHKFLNETQKVIFNNDRQAFKVHKENVLGDNSYVLNDVLFGNAISLKQTEISEELMNMDSKITSCSSLTQDAEHLRIKQNEVKKSMFIALFLRWFP